MEGQLFVISSPSGGGKTSVIASLLENHPALSYSVSATTRPPRRAERHGVEYYFLDRERFKQKIQEDAFLEWAEVHGFYYGTLNETIASQLSDGKHILLDIDVQGGVAVKQIHPEAVLIFLMPPSMEVLEQRLRERGTDDDAVIAERLNNARSEISAAEAYDYLVWNHDLHKTIQEVEAIVFKSVRA